MEKMQVQIVLEVLGRPPQNVTDALNKLLSKLETEKGMKVLEKKMHEPVVIKEANDLYTAFLEVTLELDSIEHYFGLIFAYMPSHIEMIYPENISITNSHLNQLAGQLVQRIHNYDAVAKNLLVERDILLKKMKEIAPHLFSKEKNNIITGKQDIQSSEKKVKKSKKQSKKKSKS